MAELPSGLLEACVVLGASTEKLRELYQFKELPLLEAEVLQVHAPPFVTKETRVGEATGHAPAFSRVQRRRSFIKKKKREGPTAANGGPANHGEGGGATEDISVPKDIDLIALPQLCFPGGLQVTNEQREDSYHFLVFTDVLGNRTHGVVVQYYRPIQAPPEGGLHNGLHPSPKPRLYAAHAVCLISKHPYYNALRDCLSSLTGQLKSARALDCEEKVKEFSAKLALVPVPPPGQLHVGFSLRPLQVFLPSREDQDRPAVDLDLHLAFLCFRPTQLLQVLASLLTEQRVVLLSVHWARLTLVAEAAMLFLRPLSWQHPYVPVLAHQMLDFLMAPTAYLMGCHLQHYDQVAAETEGLVLANIDEGSVFSSSEAVDLPDIPQTARDYFTTRVEGLQMHYDLALCQQGSSTEVNEQRARRRAWQSSLNTQIQNIALELIVNIFRDVHEHLNYEHRVFNSEEFLQSREPSDQPFYRKVLETHMFHSFLRDRLNRKMDAFTRLELSSRTEAHKLRAMTESPRRPTMQELAARKHAAPERLSRRLGHSLPNLATPPTARHYSLSKIPSENSSLRVPQSSIQIFMVPEFPPPLAYQYVQNFHYDIIALLGTAIAATPAHDSALLARYHYLRGFVRSVAGRRLDALDDFQALQRTDSAVFPAALVSALLDSLAEAERAEAGRRPELKRLISRVKRDTEERERDRRRGGGGGGGGANDDDGGGTVKRFRLPRKHMHQEEFVRHVQESGIVRDQDTIHRLFHALTVDCGEAVIGCAGEEAAAHSVFYLDSALQGQQKQVDPEVFRVFYTFWKETEAEAQEVALPPAVLERLENSECVFKLSSSVKTSGGVGKLAMTQKRLFLLTEGRPGYVEVAKYRDIEEVKISSAPFLLLRIRSLKIRSASRKEAFEVNLKTECDLWNLMVKEMWAGRKMADMHKDPQFMQQALTNALLMDAVVGCLQSQRAVYSASKLAHYTRMSLDVPMMVPKTTSETLKHKINPSLDMTAPQAVDVLLYTPGELGVSEAEGDGNPKLWVALGNGKVVVFDAASWSLQQTCVQAGSAPLNCMLGVDRRQVWIGSQDSVIYIISTRSMSCNKQLTDHRSEVTGLALGERSDKHSPRVAYSCSAEGAVLQWDTASLQVRRQFRLSCDRLQALHPRGGTLWCCARDCVMEVWRTGALQRRTALPEQLRGSEVTAFSCLLLLPELEQLWTVCEGTGEVCVWPLAEPSKPLQRIQLPDCAGVTCMIRVKSQVWVGGRGGAGGGRSRGKIYVLDPQRHLVEKELAAHGDTVQALCSAEDRYVLSGSAREDGKIAIWKVEERNSAI